MKKDTNKKAKPHGETVGFYFTKKRDRKNRYEKNR